MKSCEKSTMQVKMVKIDQNFKIKQNVETVKIDQIDQIVKIDKVFEK